MININQTSENSKIYIQRNITNDEPVINNYVTEDELQEILKEHNSIPYLVIDNLSILDGDFDAVYDAINNKQPYYIYKKRNSGELIDAECAAIRDNYIDVIFCVETYYDNELHFYFTSSEIYSDRVNCIKDEIIDIPTQFKTVNGNEITGTGDIIIESGNGNIVELTQSEYNSITPEENTLYVISDAPAVEIPDTSEFVTESELNSKGYTTSNSFKTINNQSIVGSGNINIEAGGGTEILYLWKLNGTTTYGAAHNASVRNTLLSLSSSEEYPIIVVKDYNNDTICNNVYANASSNYVEIQCCNSRIGGTPNDLTDERYELLPTGMFRYVKNDIVATQNYVDEQIGDINSVLENIIG